MKTIGFILRRIAPALVPLAFIIWFAVYLRPEGGGVSPQWFTLAIGVAFGVTLQRSRFCFLCILRDYFEKKDGSGLVGVLVALLVGSVGYIVVFGGWLANPLAGYLPPNAHIGPVSWVLVAGAVIFGWGMALSGSCISAHLYRLGEGSVLSPVALVGAFFGYWIGFRVWNTLYTDVLYTAPVVWLPAKTGYLGALALQALVLVVLLLIVLRRVRRRVSAGRIGEPPAYALAGEEAKLAKSGEVLAQSRPALQADSAASLQSAAVSAGDGSVLTLREIGSLVFIKRWPAWVGGIIVGLLGTFAYLRFAPLGVTAQIGSLSRGLGDRLGVLPERLEGLDSFAGCATRVGSSLLNDNGVLVLGLVAGAFITGIISGEFEIEKKRPRDFIAALAGGVLLGFGGMISLGCTIGTFLSGISAFAVSGWVFGAFMVLGVWTGLKGRRVLLG